MSDIVIVDYYKKVSFPELSWSYLLLLSISNYLLACTLWLPLCTGITRDYCPPCTSNPHGYYSVVIHFYGWNRYVCICPYSLSDLCIRLYVALYPGLLPYGSRYCSQMTEPRSSREFHSSMIPSWKFWVISFSKTLLRWSHGGFDCFSSGFSVLPLAVIGLAYLYTIGAIHSCIISHIFTITFILIVNWAVH